MVVNNSILLYRSASRFHHWTLFMKTIYSNTNRLIIFDECITITHTHTHTPYANTTNLTLWLYHAYTRKLLINEWTIKRQTIRPKSIVGGWNWIELCTMRKLLIHSTCVCLLNCCVYSFSITWQLLMEKNVSKFWLARNCLKYKRKWKKVRRENDSTNKQS